MRSIATKARSSTKGHGARSRQSRSWRDARVHRVQRAETVDRIETRGVQRVQRHRQPPEAGFQRRLQPLGLERGQRADQLHLGAGAGGERDRLGQPRVVAGLAGVVQADDARAVSLTDHAPVQLEIQVLAGTAQAGAGAEHAVEGTTRGQFDPQHARQRQGARGERASLTPGPLRSAPRRTTGRAPARRTAPPRSAAHRRTARRAGGRPHPPAQPARRRVPPIPRRRPSEHQCRTQCLRQHIAAAGAAVQRFAQARDAAVRGQQGFERLACRCGWPVSSSPSMA